MAFCSWGTSTVPHILRGRTNELYRNRITPGVSHLQEDEEKTGEEEDAEEKEKNGGKW